ncbi:MAG: sigma 54-interacting transcriptional regulator [Acidobacteriota bacterium]
MPLFTPQERSVAEALSELTHCNPFLRQRIAWEKQALGDEFVAADAVWIAPPGAEPDRPNLLALERRVTDLVHTVRQRLADGEKGSAADRRLYADLVLYHLYYRHQRSFVESILRSEGKGAARLEAPFYRTFAQELEDLLGPAGVPREGRLAPAHLFACFFQVRRAFHYIHRHILGRSMPAARLRARVWESIFTHDLRRFQTSLYDRLGDITTLVTGPSGTGKELVARAIGLSRYVPFQASSGAFEEHFQESFYPLNLSALSPTLIESELFGHRRGSFTGALTDRTGWLEICPPLGTVFLDEIGEIDLPIQVKLLRVLESRTFQRLGETGSEHRSRRFLGKAVAATNRDLAAEMARGAFRQDLYYRLCSDTIETPSLAERLDDDPAELGDLLTTLAARLVDPDDAPALASEVQAWVEENLGREYRWPGNVRELGQCLRNVLIRRDYRPAKVTAPSDPRRALAEEIARGDLSADEVLGRYCTLVYADAGSYQAAARRLGLDRRTVKAKVDPQRLENLRQSAPS